VSLTLIKGWHTYVLNVCTWLVSVECVTDVESLIKVNAARWMDVLVLRTPALALTANPALVALVTISEAYCSQWQDRLNHSRYDTLRRAASLEVA
jgi:hypothetical protein